MCLTTISGSGELMNSVQDPRMAYKSARSVLLSAGNAYGISIAQPIEPVLVTIPDSLEAEIGNCEGGECDFASDHTYLSQENRRENRDDGECDFASDHTYLRHSKISLILPHLSAYSGRARPMLS
ncbi:hypothetical protein HPB47_017426 [Ixodes persulcatus]|uniref:Uncharacterized protein n=1 Tax=Ixodes persulcatus TaxID=34615 RepID=A0AC60QNC0_IXOPE|nr:hypothetical protein HPB47_017426 [Ixodes persulcatus]